MNISTIGLGILLMAVGFLFAFVTFGFGIICSWPLILIGFILFILGFVTPSRSFSESQSFNQSYNETKRVCAHCGKSMPLHAPYCPHCGEKNKYD